MGTLVSESSTLRITDEVQQVMDRLRAEDIQCHLSNLKTYIPGAWDAVDFRIEFNNESGTEYFVIFPHHSILLNDGTRMYLLRYYKECDVDTNTRPGAHYVTMDEIIDLYKKRKEAFKEWGVVK